MHCVWSVGCKYFGFFRLLIKCVKSQELSNFQLAKINSLDTLFGLAQFISNLCLVVVTNLLANL